MGSISGMVSRSQAISMLSAIFQSFFFGFANGLPTVKSLVGKKTAI
jgi:hypothetical protein